MEETRTAVSRRTRWVVYLFLAVFSVTGVAHLEVWPFTGFKLFSEVRSAERESWHIVAVDSDGDESTVHLAELPVAFRNTTRLILGFDDMTAIERDEVCNAWVAPLRSTGADVAEVRIYALVASIRPDGPPPVRTLAYRCGSGP